MNFNKRKFFQRIGCAFAFLGVFFALGNELQFLSAAFAEMALNVTIVLLAVSIFLSYLYKEK